MRQQKLGDILVAMGALDPLELTVALDHQRRWGTMLGRAVVEKRFCSADQVLRALAQQTGLSTLDLDRTELDPEMKKVVSRQVAEQHRLVPLWLEGERDSTLVVAIGAPASGAAIEAARVASRKQRVKAYLAPDSAIDRALARLFASDFAETTTHTVPIQFTQPMRFDEIERMLRADARSSRRVVKLYGWPQAAAQAMESLLRAEHIEATIVDAVDVLDCSDMDVLFAPLPTLESLYGPGKRFPGKLLLASKRPARELYRAQAMGAQALLGAPVDAQELVRAVQACLPERSARTRAN